MKDPHEDASTPYDNLPEVNSYDQIPSFVSEEEEDEFWSTHTLGEGILKTMRRRSIDEALGEIRTAGAGGGPDGRTRRATKPKAAPSRPAARDSSTDKADGNEDQPAGR